MHYVTCCGCVQSPASGTACAAGPAAPEEPCGAPGLAGKSGHFQRRARSETRAGTSGIGSGGGGGGPMVWVPKQPWGSGHGDSPSTAGDAAQMAKCHSSVPGCWAGQEPDGNSWRSAQEEAKPWLR